MTDSTSDNVGSMHLCGYCGSWHTYSQVMCKDMHNSWHPEVVAPREKPPEASRQEEPLVEIPTMAKLSVKVAPTKPLTIAEGVQIAKDIRAKAEEARRVADDPPCVTIRDREAAREIIATMAARRDQAYRRCTVTEFANAILDALEGGRR